MGLARCDLQVEQSSGRVEQRVDPGRQDFLPPYSPDFNPIEVAFAKLKALLRARAERNVEALWNATGKLISAFKPDECANHFAAAGYDAT